jgi:hypothetical protein
MRYTLLSLVLLALTSSPLLGQAHIIKQRARELSDQNNARQGAPPRAPSGPVRPAPPGAPAGGAPAVAQPTVASPEVLRKYDIGNLKSEIAALKPGAQVGTAQMERITRNLGNASRGVARPSAKAVGVLAADLAKVLPQAELAASGQAQLAEDLVTVLNCGALQPSHAQGVIARIESDLSRAGVSRREAAGVGDDLRAIASELHGAKR